jgi:hypothetical protein
MWLIIVLIVAGFGGAGGVAVAATALGGPTPAQPPPPRQVQTWIAQADRILIAHGTSADDLGLADHDQWLIISHESGGNPTVVNHSDSNAAAGHPSIGEMQTIQPTFDRWKLPGYGDIDNPVDNIIAGTRYAIAGYGSIQNVPGVIAVHEGRPYVGY